MLLIPIKGWSGITFNKGKIQKVVVSSNEEDVVHTALQMFQQDYVKVFDTDFKFSDKKGNIMIGTLGLKTKAESLLSQRDIAELSAHDEAFVIKVVGDKLVIAGSDKRGTAYGILELSRLIGVSPWEWWADSPIEKKEQFSLPQDYRNLQYPSVARRGIFLNDEDWGLTPWSNKTYEPSEVKGRIGPQTHARIFELLLRLRANTFWPAMHKCSEAFYLTPGNKEVADKYGIYVGTSHCEPMVRNTNAEWKKYGEGDYNYITNRENVLKFWEQRVKELEKSDNIFTLGIRGVHDGKMEGAKTAEQQKEALANVLKDQREMLARVVNPDVTKISQVFIPYKEVLYAYKLGLEVPEDVTLMWTDDNYGYIRHFPDSVERSRKGGNGMYYHISYWGRPHDYLWLASTHPAQVYTQMKLAYDKGVQDMWVLNVGDIKPAEYLIELFLDMAWDIKAIPNNKEGLNQHLKAWLSREFGMDMANQLLPVMNEYYRLAYIRKPEFMGNTRTEERDPKYKVVSDLPWSESYIRSRLYDYEAIEEKVKALTNGIVPDKKYSWFQLVEYPVLCAAEMNKKHLFAQLARHGKSNWELSEEAYEQIQSLTERYNSENNGKWNRMMSSHPRNLPVYQQVSRTKAENSMKEEVLPLYKFNGEEYHFFNGTKPIETGMGYENGAIQISKGSSVIFEIEVAGTDSLLIEMALAPNHPVDGEQIRYAISVNEEPLQVIDYSTKGRSEEWKLNVLGNQAKRKTKHMIQKLGVQRIEIKAIDEGVILDQILIFN